MELSKRDLLLALVINSSALAIVSALVALSIFSDNWVVSPLYILICSLAHRPFIKFPAKVLVILQVMTFLLFIVINWLLLSIVLRFATI